MDLRNTVAGIRALWSGQRGLGTTFWVGAFVVNALAALIFVWLEFLLANLSGGPAYGPVKVILTLLYVAGFAYNLLLLGGLWRSARATPEVGGWRWIALLMGFALVLTYADMIFRAR